MTDVHALTLAEIREGLERGDFSSREVVSTLLERIEAHDGDLNAFITVTAEQALDAAGQADDARANGTAGRWPDYRSFTKTSSVRATSDHLRVADARGLRLAVQRDRRRRLASAGAIMLRQDQYGRVRDGLVERKPATTAR